MTCVVSSLHPADLPIVVQDHRRRGFYTIDNEIIDRYGAQLKPTGIATYNGLARFANRDGECFPSQTTLAKRLGMSRMQVIREIDKLKKLGLIEVKPQFGPDGGQRANLYLLLDVPKAEEPVKHRYTPGNREIHLPVTERDTPCNRRLPKQNTAKKTQTEQDLEQPVVVAVYADSSNLLKQEATPETPQAIRESDDEKRLAEALMARGLAKAVAQNLVQTYEADYIQEKLDYLTFLQDTQPERVLKPCGWLRRAIENNYAAPDDYHAPEEHELESLEVEHLEEVLQQEYEQVQRRKEEERILREQAATARITAIQATYGTTEREVSVWTELLEEFRLTMPTATFTRYFADTLLLAVHDGEAIIGLPNIEGCDWLANRFGKKLEQALADRFGEQSYTVRFVDLRLALIPEPLE